VLMALTPLKALRLVKARFEGDYVGRVMREGCKSAGERRRGGFMTGVGRDGEGGESDRWGPVDRETRERRPAREGVI
jgi:hypothetical protein